MNNNKPSLIPVAKKYSNGKKKLLLRLEKSPLYAIVEKNFNNKWKIKHSTIKRRYVTQKAIDLSEIQLEDDFEEIQEFDDPIEQDIVSSLDREIRFYNLKEKYNRVLEQEIKVAAVIFNDYFKSQNLKPLNVEFSSENNKRLIVKIQSSDVPNKNLKPKKQIIQDLEYLIELFDSTKSHDYSLSESYHYQLSYDFHKIFSIKNINTEISSDTLTLNNHSFVLKSPLYISGWDYIDYDNLTYEQSSSEKYYDLIDNELFLRFQNCLQAMTIYTKIKEVAEVFPLTNFIEIFQILNSIF